MELYKGRPQTNEGRAEKEINVYNLLDKLGMWYERTDHEPADTMEACNRIDSVLGVIICKNLFLCNRQKTKFYLLMMPGDKPFKTKELSSKLSISRLSFAPQEDMERLLNITPGSVSIMGLMNDKNHEVNLIIDEDVVRDEYIGCHPAVNTSSLKLKTKEVLEKFLPFTGHSVTYVELSKGEE